MAVDNLITSLKNKIITAYNKFVLKAKKGYPLEDYEVILEAIMAIDYINTFDVPDAKQIKILDYYIVKLNHI